MRTRSLSTLAALALLAGAAQAQTNLTIEEVLEACADGLVVADMNRDGWLTPLEAEVGMEGNFSLLDGDADGAVTADEFAACRTGSMTETRRSATLYASHVFFDADTDGDGALDRDTWLAQSMVQLSKVPFGGGGANPVSFDAVMQGFSLPSDELDADGDGLIQELEASAGILPGFDRTDANGDGMVTVTEHVTRDVAADLVMPSAEEMQARLRGIWAGMDADNDGGVTFEEYLASGMARYQRAADAALSDPEVGVPVGVLADVR